MIRIPLGKNVKCYPAMQPCLALPPWRGKRRRRKKRKKKMAIGGGGRGRKKEENWESVRVGYFSSSPRTNETFFTFFTRPHTFRVLQSRRCEKSPVRQKNAKMPEEEEVDYYGSIKGVLRWREGEAQKSPN